MKKVYVKKICSFSLSVFMTLSIIFGEIRADFKVYSMGSETLTDYLVVTNTDKQAERVEDEFVNNKVINGNGEECLEDNHIITVSLTKKQAGLLSKQKGVKLVEKDNLVRACIQDGEDRVAHQKEIKRVRHEMGDEEWNLCMIKAEEARKQVKRKNKKPVKIAILDSGVDYNPDMNIIDSISLVPGEEEISPLFMDASGHGTSVAGLAAAKYNDNRITGVDPYAEIYSIRVLDNNNTAPVSRIIEAIYMAIDREVDIINMSFGVAVYSKALEDAVKAADQAGILMFAAAGNTGKIKSEDESTVLYPAAFDEVIAVGAVDKEGEVTESSAIGKEIELVAPGELVRSSGMFDCEIVESGTSLAAPQVAGAAALIWEMDREVSADFIRSLLKNRLILMEILKDMDMV